MQRNGPISSWDQQGEANWSKEVRESELNSSSTKKKKKQKQKHKTAHGKRKWKKAEGSRSGSGIWKQKNDF